jgi:hypothetical protein
MDVRPVQAGMFTMKSKVIAYTKNGQTRKKSEITRFHHPESVVSEPFERSMH